MQNISPIEPVDAIRSALSEIEIGLRYIGTDQILDSIDREHIEKAAAILRLLIGAQQ